LIEKLQRCFVTSLLFGCEIFYLGEALKAFFFTFAHLVGLMLLLVFAICGNGM
jgi:hypothetical protein